ncbi:hypothetical protein P389DRAFT_180399 [Cystobasidium minutum MCA 4210]|uniref:uncharacterized protein n=1 Tax=Cystobasidium minutum MCA 4210 TaxID=1397322 RepID=UPI0034D00612|eukprot:jgi/Rhomi1/180399/fgenesh1_pg.4_\
MSSPKAVTESSQFDPEQIAERLRRGAEVTILEGMLPRGISGDAQSKQGRTERWNLYKAGKERKAAEEKTRTDRENVRKAAHKEHSQLLIAWESGASRPGSRAGQVDASTLTGGPKLSLPMRLKQQDTGGGRSSAGRTDGDADGRGRERHSRSDGDNSEQKRSMSRPKARLRRQ